MKYKIYDKDKNLVDDITILSDGSLFCGKSSKLLNEDNFHVIWEAKKGDIIRTKKPWNLKELDDNSPLIDWAKDD